MPKWSVTAKLTCLPHLLTFRDSNLEATRCDWCSAGKDVSPPIEIPLDPATLSHPATFVRQRSTQDGAPDATGRSDFDECHRRNRSYEQNPRNGWFSVGLWGERHYIKHVVSPCSSLRDFRSNFVAVAHMTSSITSMHCYDGCLSHSV